MTWRSFVDYVIMRELGQEDAVYRNYDLTHRVEARIADHFTYAISAAERIGMETNGVALNYILAEVAMRLSGMGYTIPNFDYVERTMNEWYIWDRIRKGSLKRWKTKAYHNPLI